MLSLESCLFLCNLELAFFYICKLQTHGNVLEMETFLIIKMDYYEDL